MTSVAGNRSNKSALTSSKGAALIAVFLIFLVGAFYFFHSKQGSASTSFSSRSSVPSPIKKWEFDLGEERRGSFSSPKTPAIDSDGIVYAAANGTMAAINPDGTLKWDYHNPSGDMNSPVIDDTGILWLGTGTLGWLVKFQGSGVGENFLGTTALQQIGTAFDGTIYIAGRKGFQAIDPRTASTKWSGGGESFALLDSGDIVTTDGRGYLYVYGPGGEIKSTAKSPAQPCTAPAIGSDGTIYVGCGNSLQVSNPDGSGKWAFPVDDLVGSPAIDADGNIYFGSRAKKVFALSADGLLKWMVECRGEVRTTPAISHNGRIFVSSSDGVLHALSAETGSLLWEFKGKGVFFSPTIAADGTIYVQTSAGKVYAIQDTEPNGGLWGQWPKVGADLRNNSRGTH